MKEDMPKALVTAVALTSVKSASFRDCLVFRELSVLIIVIIALGLVACAETQSTEKATSTATPSLPTAALVSSDLTPTQPLPARTALQAELDDWRIFPMSVSTVSNWNRRQPREGYQLMKVDLALENAGSDLRSVQELGSRSGFDFVMEAPGGFIYLQPIHQPNEFKREWAVYDLGDIPEIGGDE